MTTQPWRIDQALAAHLELLSGGVSGASTYRVHGLPEACVLKLTKAESADYIRARAYREIYFYEQLAEELPLHTPRLLASCIQESGECALLIAAYQPLKVANQLCTDDFAQIATQLAHLHAKYWNLTESLSSYTWLPQPMVPDLAQDVQHARETWHVLAQRPQFRTILTASRLHDIEGALVQISTKPEYSPAIALTLCHGDCHLDNLLCDQNGDLIWADWQEIQIGHGPTDLTFLIQRAEANSATITHDVLIAAYCTALEADGVEGVDQHAITAAMNESERRTRLLYWPDYMHDATTERMAQHLTRIFSV